MSKRVEDLMHSIKNLQQELKEEVKRIRIETYEIRDRSIRFKDEVRRADYMVMDRKYLGYLNIIEKANGLFCAYFNGLIAYVGDIGVRTEQYWCPMLMRWSVAEGILPPVLAQ